MTERAGPHSHPQNMEPLRVFISSMMGELKEERQIAERAVEDLLGVLPWLFERSEASSQTPENLYLEQVRQADIVIWLVGSETSPAVTAEIHTCMDHGIPLLTFRLPAHHRDMDTQDLLERTKEYATYKKVESSEDLAHHIREALESEIIQGYRNQGSPSRTDQLQERRNYSLGLLKRMWVSLGVPDNMAAELAADLSVGDVLETPGPGVHVVVGVQGSGKTLAVSRQFQKAVTQVLEDFSMPYPLFVEARQLRQPLLDYVQQQGQQYSFNPSRGIFMVVDGLDEIGISEANELLKRAEAYAEANDKATLILAGRLLPGLNLNAEHRLRTSIPRLSDQEAMSLIGKVAGRVVKQSWHSWTPSIQEAAQIPLFAVMIGSELREKDDFDVPNPSQLIERLAKRTYEGPEGLKEETYELLKVLAAKAVSYGTGVDNIEVSPKIFDHKFLADSRLVNDSQGVLDFTLAVMREWFAVRALAEQTITVDEILSVLDRWFVPLRITMESGDRKLIRDLLSRLARSDSGMASLLLQDYEKSIWYWQDPGISDLGTVDEVGQTILEALEDWRTGLGNLFPVIGPVRPDGEIKTLGIEVWNSGVRLSWYEGEEILDKVVETPISWTTDWPARSYYQVPNSQAWPWLITMKELSKSLKKAIQSKYFPLETVSAVHERAWELSPALSKPRNLQEMWDKIQQTDHGNGLKHTPLRFRDSSGQEKVMTYGELQLVGDYLQCLIAHDKEFLVAPWPTADFAEFSRYSGPLLLERTNAIYTAALQIYRELVEQWFQAFSDRLNLYQLMPVRLVGELVFPRHQKAGSHEPWLHWRTHVVSDEEESTAIFVLEQPPWSKSSFETYWREEEERIATLRSTAKIQPSPRFVGQVPDVLVDRPATSLAYKWLADELRALGWDIGL